MPILNYYKLRDMIRKRCMGDWRMRVEFNPVSFRNNHKIDLNVQNDSNIALELPVDSFENSETEENNELLFGPYGHPYSGRSIISKTGSQEKKLSFFKWLFHPDRKNLERPKTFIENLFSLGDANFDDEVARYHAEQAIEVAKGLIGVAENIMIPLGDLNNDEIVEKIVSGINVGISLNGGDVVDVIGTLVNLDDVEGADCIVTMSGEIIEIGSAAVKVVQESALKLKDLKEIPKIIAALQDYL